MFEMKKREATATMACKVSKAEIYEKATFSRENITVQIRRAPTYSAM